MTWAVWNGRRWVLALDEADLMCVLVGRRPTAARRACAPPHAWRKRAMQHTGRSAPQLARPVDACLSDDSALRENAATTRSGHVRSSGARALDDGEVCTSAVPTASAPPAAPPQRPPRRPRSTHVPLAGRSHWSALRRTGGLVRRRQARTCAHDNTSRKPSTSHRNVPALGGDDGNDEGIAVGHGSLGAERGALVGPGNIRGRATSASEGPNARNMRTVHPQIAQTCARATHSSECVVPCPQCGSGQLPTTCMDSTYMSMSADPMLVPNGPHS